MLNDGVFGKASNVTLTYLKTCGGWWILGSIGET
jgi:hypothetical protein